MSTRRCPTCGQAPPIDLPFADAPRRWRLVCATLARRRGGRSPGAASRRASDSRGRRLTLVPRPADAPARGDTPAHGERVRDWMSAVTALLCASTPVPQAERLMRRHEVRHLPVVRGSRLVGIVTDRDLLFAPPERTGAGRDGDTDRRPTAPSVRDVMSRPVVTIGPDETIGRAAGLMLASRASCLPVLDGERLVGLLTTADLLRALAAGEGAATPGRR